MCVCGNKVSNLIIIIIVRINVSSTVLMRFTRCIIIAIDITIASNIVTSSYSG